MIKNNSQFIEIINFNLQKKDVLKIQKNIYLKNYNNIRLILDCIFKNYDHDLINILEWYIINKIEQQYDRKRI